MFVKFTVGNFLSFKEKVTIDLTSSSISEYKERNVASTSSKDLGLLKGAVLYGANSSGKSNLFKAIKFFKYLILDSAKNLQAGEEFDIEPFRLSTTTANKPSFLEIEIIVEGFKYRYGFEVDNHKVHREWLYRQKKIKESKIFERKGGIISREGKFDFNEALLDKTRENALMLSVSSQFNGEIATSIVKRIKQIKFISGTRDQYHYLRTIELAKDKRYREHIQKFISSANLGFDNFTTESIILTEDMLPSNMPSDVKKMFLKNQKEEVFVNTEHIIYDEDNKPSGITYFNLQEHESLGARKYFSLSGPIIEALIKGSTLIIDEFDTRMHPILSKAIVALFNSKEENQNNAQLIFATHNPNLLSSEILRRDQIIMTKKDDYGVTRIQTLASLKVRKDASFEKDYLMGKYEAIPKIKFSNQLSLFDN